METLKEIEEKINNFDLSEQEDFNSFMQICNSSKNLSDFSTEIRHFCDLKLYHVLDFYPLHGLGSPLPEDLKVKDYMSMKNLEELNCHFLEIEKVVTKQFEDLKNIKIDEK